MTTKSITRSRDLAKLSLIVSAANVRSFVGFLKIFKAEMKAMVIVMPTITVCHNLYSQREVVDKYW